MSRRQLHPSTDLLYAGLVTLAELDAWEEMLLCAGQYTFADLAEYQARGERPPLKLGRTPAPPPQAEPAVEDDEPLQPLLYLGQPRKFRDVKCRCDKPLPYVDWYGYDAPLEQWCFHCGRVMPRPYDAKFPLSERDRAMALPTVEVGIIAEAIS